MKKKIKLAWFHPHLKNWTGGSNYIYEVCQRMRKVYDLVILTSVLGPIAESKIRPLDIPVYELSGKSTDDQFYWIFLKSYINKEYEKAYRYIKYCDVVISSHFPFNIIAEKFNKPHIYCCWEPCAFFHDENYINGLNYYERMFIKFIALFYKNLDIEATKKADKILTLSKFNKEWIKRVYQRNDAVITYEGVDSNFFKRKKDIKLEQRYKGFKVIMHSTDFTAIKGTNFLILSLPEILKKFPKTKVLITYTLENQKEKKKIENLARKMGVLKTIEFLGRIEYTLLPFYYTLANVVVQPSIKQSMSLSVKEAMACKTPIVTSLEGEEQTKNGKAGFLVNPKDVIKSSRAILEILRNEKLAKRMGEEGRRIVIKKFSWEAVTNVFIKTIESLNEKNQ